MDDEVVFAVTGLVAVLHPPRMLGDQVELTEGDLGFQGRPRPAMPVLAVPTLLCVGGDEGLQRGVGDRERTYPVDRLGKVGRPPIPPAFRSFRAMAVGESLAVRRHSMWSRSAEVSSILHTDRASADGRQSNAKKCAVSRDVGRDCRIARVTTEPKAPWSGRWRRTWVGLRGEVEEVRRLGQLEAPEDVPLAGGELASLGDGAV